MEVPTASEVICEAENIARGPLDVIFLMSTWLKMDDDLKEDCIDQDNLLNTVFSEEML